MKKYTIEELLNKIDESKREDIINLYIKGASRDTIALIVKKDKNLVQSFINYLREDTEIYKNHLESKKEIKRVKRTKLDFETFRDLYLGGASLDYIRNNYHTSKEYVMELKKQLDDYDVNIHKENEDKYSEKYNEKFVKNLEEKYNFKPSPDNIFGRDVRHRNYNVYCRLDFLNFHALKNYETSNEELHLTQVIIKGIKGLGDLQSFIDIYEKYYNDIDWTTPPFCKDYKENKNYTLSELKAKMRYHG